MRRLRFTVTGAVLVTLGCATEKLPPSENSPPVANAGRDRTAMVGELVELDATSSQDRDGDPMTFRWELVPPSGSTVALDRTSGEVTAFTPDLAGGYTVRLIAHDGYADSAPAEVEIEVTPEPENRPPIAVVGSNFDVAVGVTVTLDGSESYDPDKNSLSYDWQLSSRPSDGTAEIDDRTSDTPTLTPDVAGTWEATLVVHDGELYSEPETITIAAIEAANRPPIAEAGRDVTVATGSVVELDGTNSADPEGEALAFIWSLLETPAGSTTTLSASDVPRPTFETDVDGAYRVQLVVTDGELSSEPDTMTVTAATGNLPPTAHAGDDRDVVVGATVMLDGSGSADPEGDSLSYAWTLDSRPTGSSAALVDETSPRPSFVPDVAGSYAASLMVSDGQLQSQPDIVVLTAGEPTPRDVGDVVVTEIMADPDSTTDAIGEWFELFNPTQFRWDLAGCVLRDDDTDTHVVASLEVPAGAYVTLARTDSPGFTPDYVYGNQFVLGNSADEIVIECDGHVIARAAYEDTVTGASWSLIGAATDELQNDDMSNWCPSVTPYHGDDHGTPGAANEFDASCP